MAARLSTKRHSTALRRSPSTARRCSSCPTGQAASARTTSTARSASGYTGAAIPRHRAERVERGARAESSVPIPTHQPNDPLAVDQGVVAVVSCVASFVLLPVVFGLSCHDADAQNTAWLLHSVVTRCVFDLLWDQKVPGSNPGAPIVRRSSSATTSAVGLFLRESPCCECPPLQRLTIRGVGCSTT